VLYGLAANVGKRSVLLDVTDNSPRGGRDAFERLISRSDVLVANATSDSLARLGCSPSHLAALQPDLVLCRFDAWGGPNEGAGPRAQHLGYDDNVQAALGIMERFGGGLGRVEEHAHIGTIDVIAGVGGAVATVAALYLRETRRKLRRNDPPSSSNTPPPPPPPPPPPRRSLLVARASLAALGLCVQFPFCCGVPSDLAAEACVAPATLGPLCRGEHALLRCYEAADGEWLLLHASLHDPASSLHDPASSQHGPAAPTSTARSMQHAATVSEGLEVSRGLQTSRRLETRRGLEVSRGLQTSRRLETSRGLEVSRGLEQLGSAHPALLAAIRSAKHEHAPPPTALHPSDGSLAAALAAAFRSTGLSAASWVQLLRAHGVAAVQLRSLAQLRQQHACARIDLHGPSFQFVTDTHHPAGSPLTYFAPVAVRPRHTPLALPLRPAPRYGEHTRQVLMEAGVQVADLVARGVASDGWSTAYLPGHTPIKPTDLPGHIQPPLPTSSYLPGHIPKAPTEPTFLPGHAPKTPPPPIHLAGHAPPLSNLQSLSTPTALQALSTPTSLQAPLPSTALPGAGHAPPPPPTPTVADERVTVRSAAPSIHVRSAAPSMCPICMEADLSLAHVRRVELACSHSLCGECATRCGEAGHRRCPLCREPHLLHPTRLAERSAAWRKNYASWRVGGQAGARGELAAIRTPSAAEQVVEEEEAGGAAGGGVGAAGGVGHSVACGDMHHASPQLKRRSGGMPTVKTAPTDLAALERSDGGGCER